MVGPVADNPIRYSNISPSCLYPWLTYTKPAASSERVYMPLLRARQIFKNIQTLQENSLSFLSNK